MEHTIDKAMSLAKEMGYEAGKDFASWVQQDAFGGRVSCPKVARNNAQRIIDMDEEGDPAFWPDCLPNLSGEWAGGMTPETLLEEVFSKVDSNLDLDSTDLSDYSDDICTEYENGVSDGYREEIVRLARLEVEE